MTIKREEFDSLLQQLSRQREELQLKVALAKLEVRDEWSKLDKQWAHLKEKASQAREEMDATAGRVGSSLHQAAEEIRDGFERLRKLL